MLLSGPAPLWDVACQSTEAISGSLPQLPHRRPRGTDAPAKKTKRPDADITILKRNNLGLNRYRSAESTLVFI